MQVNWSFLFIAHRFVNGAIEKLLFNSETMIDQRLKIVFYQLLKAVVW